MSDELQLLYLEARAQLDKQLDDIDAKDAKIGMVLAVAGVQAAIIATAF